MKLKNVMDDIEATLLSLARKVGSDTRLSALVKKADACRIKGAHNDLIRELDALADYIFRAPTLNKLHKRAAHCLDLKLELMFARFFDKNKILLRDMAAEVQILRKSDFSATSPSANQPI